MSRKEYKEVKYCPQPKTDDDGNETENPFKGECTIKMPSYKKRLELLKELNFKIDASGKVDSTTDQVDSAIKMVEIAERHIVGVKLVHTASGTKFDDFEELEFSKEGTDFINEIAQVVLGGATLGNG